MFDTVAAAQPEGRMWQATGGHLLYLAVVAVLLGIVAGIGSIREAAKVGKVGGGVALAYFPVLSTIARSSDWSSGTSSSPALGSTSPTRLGRLGKSSWRWIWVSE